MICHRGTDSVRKTGDEQRVNQNIKNNCSLNDSDVDDESRCGVLDVFIRDFVQNGNAVEFTRETGSQSLAESDESTLHIGTFHYFRRDHRDKRMVQRPGVSQLITVLP